MKKFLSFALLVVAILVTCCVPTRAPVSQAPVALKDFDRVLHVDDGFEGEGRAIIERAAANIRRLTQDRAHLTVVFDADFDSLDSLKLHMQAGHTLVIAVLSDFPIVAALDEAAKGPGQLLAATVYQIDDSAIVFLILDRIDASHAENVVTHEFGHVIGFPDLPTAGAIMSGSSIKGSPPLLDWTPADVALCRQYHFCT